VKSQRKRKAMGKDYYSILGVDKGADEAALKRGAATHSVQDVHCTDVSVFRAST
jgi:hypothetical protein